MRHVVGFLPFVTRGLAICAVLAGLPPGLLAVYGAGFGCFGTCPTRAQYFARIVLEALAVAVFLLYCCATQQALRAVIAVLVLVLGGMVGVAVLIALALHARATLPVWGGEEGDLLAETPLD